jgi:hypothetical protein
VISSTGVCTGVFGQESNCGVSIPPRYYTIDPTTETTQKKCFLGHYDSLDAILTQNIVIVPDQGPN